MVYKPGRCLLKQLLRERNMSQQQLADLVGMPRQQISDYANKRTIMYLPNAKTIASALKCDVDDLYEWIIEPIPVKKSKHVEE